MSNSVLLNVILAVYEKTVADSGSLWSVWMDGGAPWPSLTFCLAFDLSTSRKSSNFNPLPSRSAYSQHRTLLLERHYFSYTETKRPRLTVFFYNAEGRPILFLGGFSPATRFCAAHNNLFSINTHNGALGTNLRPSQLCCSVSSLYGCLPRRLMINRENSRKSQFGGKIRQLTKQH